MTRQVFVGRVMLRFTPLLLVFGFSSIAYAVDSSASGSCPTIDSSYTVDAHGFSPEIVARNDEHKITLLDEAKAAAIEGCKKNLRTRASCAYGKSDSERVCEEGKQCLYSTGAVPGQSSECRLEKCNLSIPHSFDGTLELFEVWYGADGSTTEPPPDSKSSLSGRGFYLDPNDKRLGANTYKKVVKGLRFISGANDTVRCVAVATKVCEQSCDPVEEVEIQIFGDSDQAGGY